MNLDDRDPEEVQLEAPLNAIAEILMSLPIEIYTQARISMCPRNFLSITGQMQGLMPVLFEQMVKAEYYKWHARRLGLGAATATAIKKH